MKVLREISPEISRKNFLRFLKKTLAKVCRLHILALVLRGMIPLQDVTLFDLNKELSDEMQDLRRKGGVHGKQNNPLM